MYRWSSKLVVGEGEGGGAVVREMERYRFDRFYKLQDYGRWKEVE